MRVLHIQDNVVKIDGTEIVCPFRVTRAWWNEAHQQIIVLMEFYENKDVKRFSNLVAYTILNEVIWKAELPKGSGADCYTDADLINDTLSAFSFSGYRCLINIGDGTLISTSFAK
ncbi:MAG TPA: hypothetical protein VFC63_27860 [Blastocatellia bacterium]|nr:hypothetical protein [Blastocatellia bacterium]